MRWYAFIAAGLVVACENPVASPALSSSAASAPNLQGGVEQSVSGGAHRWTGGEIFILSIQAKKSADGSVTGRFHVDAKSLNARMNVSVTCMTVVDNRAWIGGIIEDSNNPLVHNGTAAYFYVIDTGEGAVGAIQLDIISALRLNDTPGNELAFCAEQSLTLPSRRIEDGNVQIRG